MSKWLSEWMDILDFQLICVVTFNDRHLVSPFDFFSHVWIFPIFTFFSWDIFSFFIYRSTVRLVWVFCLFFIIIIIIMILRLVFFFLGGLVCLFRPIFFVSFIVIIMIIMMTIFIGIISHCGPVSHSLFSFLPLSLSLILLHSSLSLILSLSLSVPVSKLLSLCWVRGGALFSWFTLTSPLICVSNPHHRHHFFLIYIFFCQLISWIYFALSLSLSFFFIYFVWFLSLSLSLSLSFCRGCCSFPSDFTEPPKEPNRAKRPSRFRRSKQTEAAQQQKFPNHEGNWMTTAAPICPISSLSPPLSPRSFPSTPSGIIN